MLAIAVAVPSLAGQTNQYLAPIVEVQAFDHEKLALLEVERQKLATNIAAFAVNGVIRKPATRQFENARKFIALALHLDKRNRVALVGNAHLKRGITPKEIATDYKPEVLAEILLARAKTLRTKGGKDNVKLAGYFLFAAVEANPKNEDAVYAYELFRIDEGELNWTVITDASRVRSAVTGQ